MKTKIKRIRKKTLSAFKSSEESSTNWLSETAKKYKVVVGTIACPHCGTVCIGEIYKVCPMCDNEYFI